MIVRRTYYGWLKNGRFYLSQLPADAPSRPSVSYETLDEIKALLMRKGVEILWHPPLPDAMHAEIQSSLRMDGRREVLSLDTAEDS